MTRDEWLELAQGLEHASRVAWATANEPDNNKEFMLRIAQRFPLLARECREEAMNIAD